jgi:MoaA/NifB/PqqE/SkfB family radical SAM enzyme
MLKQGAWPRESDQFWHSLDKLLPNIRYFEFTGGEPFMIREHFELLRRAAKLGYASNITVHYNTNGTIYPVDLETVWKQFKRVEIALSIDNVGKRFEYERYPADWSQVNQNIKQFEKLKKDSTNIDLQLCFTVNVLNVLYLNELLDWAKTIDFNTIHWNMLHGPAEISIACLPVGVKEKIIQVLNQTVFDKKYTKDIDNVISMIKNGAPIDIKHLFKKLYVTDRYRKQHLSQTHPELARILNYGH